MSPCSTTLKYTECVGLGSEQNHKIVTDFMTILIALLFGVVGFLQIWKVARKPFLKKGLIIKAEKDERVLWVFRTTMHCSF